MRDISPYLLLSFAITLVTGCDRSGPARSITPAERAFVGNWYCGDGRGFNVNFILADDGRYKADWSGCLGSYGKARGTWSLVSTQIVFSAARETKKMKGKFSRLDVVQHEGNWVLVPTDDPRRFSYEMYGVRQSNSFQKQENN